MKIIFILALIFSLFACSESAQQASDATITVTDYAGEVVSLVSPAKRIVALAPHAVENVFSAGAGDRLVGVMDHSDYPEAAKDIDIVGTYQSINYERLLELKPDLVIVWQSGNTAAVVQRLKQLGFRVYQDEPKRIQDIAKSIRDIGVLAGTSAQANQVATEFLNGVDQLKRRYQNLQPVSVFYQIWHQPLQTLNGSHLVSDLITACAGNNIFADQIALAPVVSMESILAKNPQAIIGGATSLGGDWQGAWQAWPSLSAVKNNHIFAVDSDHTNRATVRLALGMKSICQHLQQVRNES